MGDIVYFELNNWFMGQDYPDIEPFISWMRPDACIKFRDEEWVRTNRLCVNWTFVDMSQNFCITATRAWVEQNCPELLTRYNKFLRYPDEESSTDVYGRFGQSFLEYNTDNIGVFFTEEEN